VKNGVGPVWRDWTLADAIAALATMAIGAGVAAALLRLFEAGWFGVVSSTLVFTLTGGAAFGVLQHRVLREVLPFLKLDSWVTRTGVGCVLIWLMVALPIPGLSPDLALAAEPGWWLSPDAVVVLGLGFGLVVGLMQAWALRAWVVRPLRWALVNFVVWLPATALLWVAAAPVYDMGPPVAALLGAVVVLAAGATAGLAQSRLVATMVEGNDDGGEYAQHVLGDLGSIDLSE
jgi:hypothetical protein